MKWPIQKSVGGGGGGVGLRKVSESLYTVQIRRPTRHFHFHPTNFPVYLTILTCKSRPPPTPFAKQLSFNKFFITRRYSRSFAATLRAALKRRPTPVELKARVSLKVASSLTQGGGGGGKDTRIG